MSREPVPIEPAHRPVMLEETMALWFSDGGGCYIDGTFGRGGHSGAKIRGSIARKNFISMRIIL